MLHDNELSSLTFQKPTLNKEISYIEVIFKNSLSFLLPFFARRGQLLWIGRLWTGPRNLLPLPEWILFKFSTKGKEREN